jgi:hypothetical protein
VLYRPSEKKMKGVKTKDYLGKAKLVAAADSTDAFTTFTGATRLAQGQNMSGAFVDTGPMQKSEPSRIPLSTSPPFAPAAARADARPQSPTTARPRARA